MNESSSSNGTAATEPPSFVRQSLRDAQKASLVYRARGWAKLMLGTRSSNIKEAIEEAIEEAFEEHPDEARQLAQEETTMLRNVLSFGDIAVEDIMVPRMDIVSVAKDIPLFELKKHIFEQRHTRIPVYDQSLDAVEGFLHVKDLLPMIAGDEPFELARVMRPMLFVPPSMKIIDLLVHMRRSGSHIAIVVDEYGGTDGLVTLEDLFEKLVGDIHDEHDEDEDETLIRREDGAVEADARVRVDRLERMLGRKLRDGEGQEEFDTLGGLIVFQLGRVPEGGEQVPHESGLRFDILDADQRRVKRVRIVQAEVAAA